MKASTFWKRLWIAVGGLVVAFMAVMYYLYTHYDTEVAAGLSKFLDGLYVGGLVGLFILFISKFRD